MISIIVPNALEENIIEQLERADNEFPDTEVIIATDRYRKGKGWSIREALKHATGDVIVFLDGDLDIHPSMIWRLVPHLQEFDIVVGKKDTRNVFSRWVLTILSRLYIRAMFGIKVSTQTGIKVFWRYALPEWECDSYAFDIEILAKAKKNGYSMFEVTVEAERSKKMRFKSIWVSLIDSFKIWRRLHER